MDNDNENSIVCVVNYFDAKKKVAHVDAFLHGNALPTTLPSDALKAHRIEVNQRFLWIPAKEDETGDVPVSKNDIIPMHPGMVLDIDEQAGNAILSVHTPKAGNGPGERITVPLAIIAPHKLEKYDAFDLVARDLKNIQSGDFLNIEHRPILREHEAHPERFDLSSWAGEETNRKPRKSQGLG